MSAERRKFKFDVANAVLVAGAAVLLATLLHVQQNFSDRAVFTVGFSGVFLGALLLFLHGVAGKRGASEERRESTPDVARVALFAGIVVLVATGLYVQQNPTDRVVFSVGFSGLFLSALLVLLHWALMKHK